MAGDTALLVALICQKTIFCWFAKKQFFDLQYGDEVCYNENATQLNRLNDSKYTKDVFLLY